MVVAREVMLLELRRGLLLSSYQCIHVHVATNAGLHSLHTWSRSPTQGWTPPGYLS